MNDRIKKSIDKLIGKDLVFSNEDKKAIQLKIIENQQKSKKFSFRSIVNGILLASVLPALLFFTWIAKYDQPIIEKSGQNISDPNQYFTNQLGEYVWKDESRRLFFGEQIETPASIDTTKIMKDMKVITIPITFESTFRENINPYFFKVVSSSGKERELYHMEVINNDGWRSGIITAGGKVTFVATFVYPKNDETWHIEFNDWRFSDSFEKVHIIELPK